MYETILSKILGDEYEQGREIGIKILSFVSENPDWEIQGSGYRAALDKAVFSVTKKPLDFFINSNRQSDYVDIRDMAMLVLRRNTSWSLETIGKLFCKHHATIIHDLKIAESRICYEKEYKEKYEKIEQKFLEKI